MGRGWSPRKSIDDLSAEVAPDGARIMFVGFSYGLLRAKALTKMKENVSISIFHSSPWMNGAKIHS